VSEFSGTIVAAETRPLREVQKGFTPFQEGDVLFAKITPCMENGKAAIARNLVNQRGYGSTEFHVLRPSALVLAEWIFAIIRTEEFRRAAASSFQGAVGQQRVTASFLEGFRIPLPPLSEQHRIVEVLQEVEAIRRLRAEAEFKTAELIPAAFFKFFWDAEDRFNSRPMRELVTEYRYGTSQSSGDRGSNTLRIPNILGDRISFEDLVNVDEIGDSLRRLQLRTGDMLFVRTNGNPDYVGRCGVFDLDDAKRELGEDVPVIFASYLIRARLNLDLMRPWFLHAFLRSPIGRARVLKQARTAAGQYNINTEGLGAIRVPVPPLDLQDNFLLEALETQQITEMVRLSEKQLTNLGASLYAHAFSGQLTKDWREANRETLSIQARERDAALKQAGATFSGNRLARIPEMQQIMEQRTDGIYSDLNREQRELLFRIQQRVGGVGYARYFSAQSLSESMEGSLRRNPQAIEGHLAVFAARGLIIPVSREEQSEGTGEFVFGNAYRLPLKDRSNRITDETGNPLTIDSGEDLGAEIVVGDYSRGRELERLAAQLENERTQT
jgi:type I restriction enzyme S subunit